MVHKLVIKAQIVFLLQILKLLSIARMGICIFSQSLVSAMAERMGQIEMSALLTPD